MKRLLFALLLLPQLATAQYKSDCFSLDISKGANELAVKTTFKKDTAFSLPINTPIVGLSVSGIASLDNDNDSYIRIIMKDCYNYEHLIYENYSLLTDELITRFSNTAIETIALDKITPDSIRVELNHATLDIASVQYIDASSTRNKPVNLTEIQKAQCEYIANQLNRNLEKRNMTWRAGVTSVSEMSYEEKKGMFGGKVPLLYGFDYYKAGIFVMPEKESTIKTINAQRRNTSSNQYVSEWDWRNRHGKNWMTSVKDQRPCQSCWIFAAVGALEAYINLYYNQIATYVSSDNELKVGYNLSEQELMSCIQGNTCQSRGTPAKALDFIKNNGVVNEECFTYAASNISCDSICPVPAERVYIENYDTIPDSADENYVKSKLFRAPLPFSIISWGHSMVLVGFKTLAVGDVIRTGFYSTITISEEYHHDLIGKTAWLFKNSWGPDWGEESGYAYVIVNTNDRYYTNSITGNISCMQHSDTDIVCEDADGDGYYFWGIGPKPTNCPSWVPDTPDGDDSNINLGPMDEYGNLQALQPNGITINTAVTYSTNQTINNRIGIVKNGTLTITGTTTLSGDAVIRVCENGTLIVDGGTLQSANLELIPGSHVIVRNNGTINMASGRSFDAPIGVIVDIQHGTVS